MTLTCIFEKHIPSFCTILGLSIVIRLVLAPFFAHPFDVYSWYTAGQDLLSNRLDVVNFLVPYYYSYFLFAFPGTILFNLLSSHLGSYTIPMSEIPPILRVKILPSDALVPGVLFDFLVKLPLIASDTVIGVLIYKMVFDQSRNKDKAVVASSLFLLNPLVIWVSSGWGMFDSLPALFTVLSAFFLLRGKEALSGISLAVSGVLKYYPFVLFLPMLILAAKRGRSPAIKSVAGFSLAMFILLIPSWAHILSNIGSLILGSFSLIPPTSATNVYYSGLSIWSIFTLFIAGFNPSVYAVVLIVILLFFSIFLVLRMKLSYLTSVCIGFSFPVISLLIGYRYIGENFIVWAIPFLSILSIQSNFLKRLTSGLGVIAFLASTTNSLIPYYMLPVYPWIGNTLVYLMRSVSQYQIAPSGVVVSGLAVGKLILAFYCLLNFSILVMIMTLISIRALRGDSVTEAQ